MNSDVDRINITDMQCRVFRMAQTKWGISPEDCATIFRKYDILGFIKECYGSLHVSSYKCALDDVETLLRNQGVSV